MISTRTDRQHYRILHVAFFIFKYHLPLANQLTQTYKNLSTAKLITVTINQKLIQQVDLLFLGNSNSFKITHNIIKASD